MTVEQTSHIIEKIPEIVKQYHEEEMTAINAFGAKLDAFAKFFNPLVKALIKAQKEEEKK